MEMINFVVTKTDYEKHLNRTQKDPHERLENVRELITFASMFKPPAEEPLDEYDDLIGIDEDDGP